MLQPLRLELNWKAFESKDLPIILHHQKELYSLNFREMSFDRTFYSNIEQWYTEGIKKHHCYSNLLLNENHELIGFYLYQWNEGTVYLMQMFVVKNFRRQGFGNILLDHYERCGLNQDAATSFLHASTINSDAVSFYERNSYMVVGEELDEQGYPRLFMFKYLC